MRHWTKRLSDLRDKAVEDRGTMAEEKVRLDYVRDLTNAKWSHGWKQLAIKPDSYAIQCSDGYLFVRLAQNETFLVRIANGDPLLDKILSFRESFAGWRRIDNDIVLSALGLTQQ